MGNKQDLYEIAITAVIVRSGKYLITRRSAQKKRWPGMWTVPGGKLDLSDYESLPKDTVNAWYNILERTVRREVKEEVGLEIKNIKYLTSIVAEYGPNSPHSVIISLIADFDSGEVVLQKEEADQYAWVTLKKAKEYSLIDGIYEELVIAENKRRGKKSEWQREK